MINLFKSFSAGGHLRTGIVILWSLLAIAAQNSFPWIFWVSVVALPAYALFRSEKEFFKTRNARVILAICLALLILQSGWAVIRSHYYDASDPGTYWHDDQNYIKEAEAIAEAWKSGFYPDFSLKGSPPYLGTLHIGYHRPLSLLFMLTGKSTFAGLWLNALCASLLPIIVALCARYLWSDDLNHSPSRLNRQNIPLVAALLAAVHPNQFYWSSYLLKDVFTAFVFLAAFTLTAGAWRRRSLSLAVAAVFIVPFLFTVRAYAAMSIIAAVACAPLLMMPRKRVVTIAASGAILLFAIFTYTTRGNHIYEQLRDSFVALAPPVLNGPASLVLQIIKGIPPLFLSPYAWLWLETPTPMYGLYPGMWFLYLAVYPFAFAGAAAAVARNHRIAVLPLAAFGVAALIFLMSSFAGNASRQRYYIEYIFILFAAYGINRPNKWWITGILVAEATFAMGQLISLLY